MRRQGASPVPEVVVRRRVSADEATRAPKSAPGPRGLRWTRRPGMLSGSAAVGTARRLSILLCLGAVATGPQPALAEAPNSNPSTTAGAATTRVLLGACGGVYPGNVRPKQWDLGCTGVSDLDRMAWHTWGGPTASGSGVTQLNNCSPSCAGGTVQEFPVDAAAFRIRKCRTNNGKVGRHYTRVRLVYELPPDNLFGRSGGRQDLTYRLSCVSPSAAVACGTVGRPPGHAFDVTAKRLSCGRARRLVRRATRLVCRRGCTTRKTLRVTPYRCRYGRLNRRRVFIPVRCSRGTRVIRFRAALD